MASLSLGRSLGYVAEFCLFCRWITAHRLHYALKFDRQGHSSTQAAQCLGCGYPHVVDPTLYTGCEHDPELALERLITLTNPLIRLRIAERLNLESSVRAGDLESGDRAELIREPIRVLSPDLLDPPGGSWLGSFFVIDLLLLPTLYVLAWLTPKPIAKGFLISALALTAATLSLVVLLAVSSPLWRAWLRRRYLRECIYPLLGRSLRPLRPTRQELETALETLKSLKVEGTRYLNLEALEEAARAPASSRDN